LSYLGGENLGIYLGMNWGQERSTYSKDYWQGGYWRPKQGWEGRVNYGRWGRVNQGPFPFGNFGNQGVLNSQGRIGGWDFWRKFFYLKLG